MQYLIGTDIGTSGTKTIIMSTDGKLIAHDLQEYNVITKKALWAEQWGKIWVDAVKKTIKNTVLKSKINPCDIKGLCISGLYGGSGISVDEYMEEVRPCLIWMDRRATNQEKWVLENIGADEIYKITHNGTDPYYGYTKILWIKDNEPENWAKIKMFLPPNAFAIYHLTGKIAIDYSSAGNIGGIFDIEQRTWSKKLLDKMQIPISMMPSNIVESSDIVGFLTEEIGNELGLLKGTPVCAGGVDGLVATLGLGIFESGKYAATIGTSMCAAFVHDKPIKAKGLVEIPYVKDGKKLSYSFGGSSTAGAIIKWFRDNFGEIEKQEEQLGGKNAYDSLGILAEKIDVGSNGLIVLPYFMGERCPVWDTNAKGTIFGLSLIHTKAHIYRAFQWNPIAYSLRHSIESTNSDIGEYILISGGVSRSKLWRQIAADVTGYPVVSPTEDVEATLGDVILAGIGTGIFNYDDVKNWNKLSDKVEPNMEAHKKYTEYYNLYLSIYQNSKNDMKKLSEIVK